MISVLIVNWNSKVFLRNCLRTVYATCANLPFEVVVVDGGSFDGCGEMLTAEFPGVLFVQCAENIGFGRCNNLGSERVSGDLLLLLNPDCELKDGAVGTLVEQFGRLSRPGIIGPRLLNSDGSLQNNCVRALPTPLNRALDSEILRRCFPRARLWKPADAFLTATPGEVEAVSGACMLVRTAVFKAVGGFSPEFFMYGEDMDLCAKVRRLGLHNYHVPSAEVFHHGGGSSTTQVNQFSTLWMRTSAETYMRLNHGVVAARCYRALQGVSALCRVSCLLPIACLLTGRRRRSAVASLKKWSFVLSWALGFSRVVKPTTEVLGSGRRQGQDLPSELQPTAEP